MANIEIKITIPESEYKEWEDFQHGEVEIMANLRAEIRDYLKRRFIMSFEIESEHNI